ncbi:MAG: hypothetical protein AAB706_01050 [Patescibacteria group bacterium]
MDSEDRRMLKHAVELSESNNKILKKLYGALVWQRISSIVYWVVIIGVTIGAYYYVQPILDSFFKFYESLTGQSIDSNQLFDAFLRKR